MFWLIGIIVCRWMVFLLFSLNFLLSWCFWMVSLFYCDYNDWRIYLCFLILLKLGFVFFFYLVFYLRNISVFVLFFFKRRIWIVFVYVFFFVFVYSFYFILRYDFVFVLDWLKIMGYDLMYLYFCVVILVCGVFEICRYLGFLISK